MRKLKIRVPDPTAFGGMATITIDPIFDRIPSTHQLVTNHELARQYWIEVCDPPMARIKAYDSQQYVEAKPFPAKKLFKTFIKYYRWLGEHPEILKMTENEILDYYERLTGEKL